MSKKPTVAVLGTGGTISSVGRGPLDLIRYPENNRMYHVDELLAAFPETAEVAEIKPVRFRAIGSPKIGPADWLELVATINDLGKTETELDGLVITHGTASLEETAYFLNLTLKVDFPVVVVGAQRPATGMGTDAGLNLVNAIRVAGSPESRGRGVLTLLNDEIHAARDVTKTSTLRLQTFRAADFGVLGHADADRVIYYRRAERRSMPDTEFDVTGLTELPRVDIALSYAGSDRAAIDAYVAAGAKGIVSAGFAPGFSTPDETAALEEAAGKGIVIVQSSRAGSGRIVEIGSMRPSKCVLADNLTPQKARILLMLALTRTTDQAAIQEMFETY